MKKRELESELRSFFSLRKKVTPIVTRKDPLEEESSGPETTTRIPSPESRRKQKFVRNLSPKARRDIIKSKLSRETLYISPSDRIGSNYSHHAKFLTLRGGERKLSSPPRRSEIESEKDSMRNYLNIVRELSEDTNETFVNSMSQRIRQEPGQKDEIENEIRNGLAKAKVLYDLRSEDARHHHGIGTKLRHILLNKIDRDMSVIDRKKSDKSIELRLERVCPTSREIERLWIESQIPSIIDLGDVCKTFACPLSIEDIEKALIKQRETSVIHIRDTCFRPCEKILRKNMLESVRGIMRDFISRRKRLRSSGRQKEVDDSAEFHDFFRALAAPHSTYVAPPPDLPFSLSTTPHDADRIDHFEPQLAEIWKSCSSLHDGVVFVDDVHLASRHVETSLRELAEAQRWHQVGELVNTSAFVSTTCFDPSRHRMWRHFVPIALSRPSESEILTICYGYVAFAFRDNDSSFKNLTAPLACVLRDVYVAVSKTSTTLSMRNLASIALCLRTLSEEPTTRLVQCNKVSSSLLNLDLRRLSCEDMILKEANERDNSSKKKNKGRSRRRRSSLGFTRALAKKSAASDASSPKETKTKSKKRQALLRVLRLFAHEVESSFFNEVEEESKRASLRVTLRSTIKNMFNIRLNSELSHLEGQDSSNYTCADAMSLPLFHRLHYLASLNRQSGTITYAEQSNLNELKEKVTKYRDSFESTYRSSLEFSVLPHKIQQLLRVVRGVPSLVSLVGS